MVMTLQGAKHVSFPGALDITVQKAVGLYNTWLSLSSLTAVRLSWVRFLQCHFTAGLL